MSSSIGTLSRKLCRSLLSIPKLSPQLSAPFCTYQLSSNEGSDPDKFVPNSDIDSVLDSPPFQSSPDSSSSNPTQRIIRDRPLENGLDTGIFKAILLGRVGESPIQRTLKSGAVVTLLSLGTGGIRINRRPLETEDRGKYANRSPIQWHRVSIYPERLGRLVMKQLVPGSILYVEGNLETKVFSDPVTGLVRQVREIAIRRNGRIIFLGQGGDAEQQTPKDELRAVGYY